MTCRLLAARVMPEPARMGSSEGRACDIRLQPAARQPLTCAVQMFTLNPLAQARFVCMDLGPPASACLRSEVAPVVQSCSARHWQDV